MAQWQFEITNNASTIIDYVMEKNPQLTRAEAEELINRNREFNSNGAPELDLGV